MFRMSFKPDKFKLALKLAIPRIKVMKNKREAHFKQLKRELAQLLESGQDQTARIRAEHVVNEEKTMAAYDLLEIYCELIVARMPMIEFQKNCPIDLKEAISSVIFASARCEEIPELKDVTKHLTAKYGKDFTSAALELRPDCGVGRLLVEKLSIKAPDGQTKLKILIAIAEEHNIKWDPESFGAKEPKTYDDLMNGPNALLEATKISAGRPNTQTSGSHYEQRPTSVQVPSPNVQSPKQIAKNDVPSSFNELSSRLSPHPKKIDYSNISVNDSISSETYPPKSKTRETDYQGMEFRNSSYGNESSFSSPRQHGNMEFKNATAAARAAAASAERASMAAQADAENLENISQQYSMDSNMSAHGMRDEEPRKNTVSTSQYEHLARRKVNNSFHGTNYEQTDSNEQYNRTGETENCLSNMMRNDDKSTRGASKSTAATFNEKSLVTNQIPDAYSQRNSSVGRQMEHFGEVSMKRDSVNEMHFVNELHGIKNTRNVDHHEIKDGEQSSYSSHSQSNTFRDDCDGASNLNGQKSENDKRNSDERTQFVNELHDIKTSDFADYQEGRTGKQSSSSSSSSGTFADDLYGVSDLNRRKSGNFSVENSSLFNDKESPQRSTIETTGFYDNASAVFDDYGSHSEDKLDLDEEHKVHEYGMNFSSPFQRSPSHPCPCTHSWSTKKKVESLEESISQSHIFSEKRSTSIFFESSTSSAAGPSHVDELPPTFDNYCHSSESEEEVNKFGRNNNYTIDSQKKNLDSHQAENSIFNQPLSGDMESRELNLGNLTDDIRNKGYRHPPYALSSSEAENDTSAGFKQSSPSLVEDSASSGSYNREPKESDEVSRKLSKRASVTRADSSDDDFEEERPKHIFSSTRDQYNRMPSSEEDRRSTSSVPVPCFGLGNSDSDEDLPKTSSKAHSRTRFPHQKNVSPSNSPRDTQKRNSYHLESFRHSQLASEATPKLVSETKTFPSDEALKMSEKEQPCTSVPDIVSLGSVKSSEAQTSIGERSTHVHPKLPDYDTLTAFLNSLKQKRQLICMFVLLSDTVF